MYAAITHLRNRAQALEDTADHLSHRVNSIAWQGFAADAMRRRADAAIVELRRCAHLHMDAASALDRHRQSALANPVGHAAHDLVDAVEGLASAIGGAL